MERRDFLKYFGIGATVVPVVGGALVPSVTAKLIEEPKADIQVASAMPPDRVLDMMHNGGPLDMQVIFSDSKGQRCTFLAKTFVTESSLHSPIDVTSYLSGGTYREFIPALYRLEWELKGVITGEPVLDSVLNPREDQR